ncbi:Serine protease 38 [Araneus ventricosus]|uniref:Serine protease 38 n=1 Tax=Araneus ventricosus TaxID=182803 RepID=A0A4Y2KRT1_ARAVE|nr:Serine protease 38 [Araneus ventricosus]
MSHRRKHFLVLLIFLLVSRTNCQKKSKMSKNCRRCGISPANKPSTGTSRKIINGIEIKQKNKYPWLVYINKEGELSCGGAIISDRFILTAAHCFLKGKAFKEQVCLQKKSTPKPCYLPTKEIKVGVLRHNGSYELFQVARIIPHPSFSINGRMGDIGLIKLKKSILCGTMSSPICLPYKNLNKYNKSLMVAGWGRYSEKNYERKLREGRMTQVHRKECLAGEDDPRTARRYLCAVGIRTDQKTCYGDSGSAIFAKFGQKYHALGITSFGFSQPNVLCSLDKPATFTKVYHYMKWIKKYVKNIPKP